MAAQKTILATHFATIAQHLRRSTVQVQGGRSRGGSGVIWRTDGLIITNAHVVQRKATLELSDGRILEGKVTARDLQQDLAALTVEATGLPAVTLEDRALRVGELVLAMGNPYGHAGALTTGIIHAVSPVNTSNHQEWIQADVRLAPGNSGGPLADAQGRIIGINSRIVDGLALAIPSSRVERFLRNGGRRPYFGVTTQPVLVPLGDWRVIGLLVSGVGAGSPAEAAGLLIGDVLISIDGQYFQAPSTWVSVQNSSSSNLLQLELLRGGKPMTCDVRVQNRTTRVEAT